MAVNQLELNLLEVPVLIKKGSFYEKIIKITAEKADDYIKIIVFNTGSHIDDKDKDGIFTSFYRADKAHSRKEGRFGLGLSIVKSIIDNHGCECGFENKENGVEFWFTMELKGN